MRTLRWLFTVCFACATVFAPTATPSASAWATDTTFLTFSAPVALPGVTLAPGTYIFRSPTELDTNIVQVLKASTRTVYYQGFTQPVERPRGLQNRLVTMGEARPGQPQPINAWFPMGKRDGHAFVYNR